MLPFTSPLPHCCCRVAVACCIAVAVAVSPLSVGGQRHTSAVLFAAIFLLFECLLFVASTLNYYYCPPQQTLLPLQLPPQPALTIFIGRRHMVTIWPCRGESPKDVIFYEKRLISLVLVLLLVGVFEPKCSFGLRCWGKFLCNTSR